MFDLQPKISSMHLYPSANVSLQGSTTCVVSSSLDLSDVPPIIQELIGHKGDKQEVSSTSPLQHTTVITVQNLAIWQVK